MYDISQKKGRVVNIMDDRPDIIIFEVDIPDEGRCRAIAYSSLTGKVKSGDEVVLNTTAVELGLGTGGYHFLCCNLDSPVKGKGAGGDFKGHIMKMRYTPFQIRTLSVEEEGSPYHETINNFTDLDGQIVTIIPLHSLLAPLAISFKNFYPGKRVVYIMTDGGSLALPLSNQVRKLVEKGFLDSTITVGQAFGGDYEAVNIFSGLAAAREVAGADLIIVGMGPGIAGTGTRLGYSGTENAFTNYAVQILKGKSIIVPRVSFADDRSRHYGLSHHSVTLLQDLIDMPVDLAFPDNNVLLSRIKATGLFDKHHIFLYPIEEIREILIKSGFKFSSMGRSFEDDPLFFVTAGLAVYRIKELSGE